MQVEIYINEEKLDTDVSTKIAETKQVNDFFEIKDRQTSRTNSFSFPKTERNKMLLGMMSFPGNTSLDPYRIHKVSIYRDGIQTVSNGIGYFKDTDDRYNIYVYSQNINLFDNISDKSIADLNLTSLNHTLSTSNWLASFNRNDYTYPIADYGKLDGNIVEINYQIPALYLKFLWNKMFQEAGFKWKYKGRGDREDYNPFLSDEWNELAISIDEGFPKQTESVNAVLKLELEKAKTSQYLGETITFLGQTYVVQALTGEISEYIKFSTKTDVDGIHSPSSSSNYNRSRIRIKESGFYKLSITGSFFNLITESAAIFVEKGGSNLFTINDDFPQEQSSIGFTNRLYLKAGEEVFVKVVTTPKNNESYYSFDVNLSMWLDNSVVAVNFSSYLSKIKQKTLFKDIIHHFGLMYYRKNDTYYFMSFEELLNPLATYSNYDAMADNTVYDDWSDKFHRVVSESTKIGNYARSNYFRYKYDSSVDDYADAALRIDDDTLESESTLLQRPYKAPERSGINIGAQLRKCFFYEKSYEDDGRLKEVKPLKSDPYFFRIIKKNGSFNHKLANTDSASTYSGEYPLMSFDELDFNNLIPKRYSAFFNTINYGKKITVELFLTILDIHTLDFTRLKYIKQLGQLYYVNKVTNFTGTGITKVELIQVRSIEKLGQFSDDFNNDFNI